MDKGDFRKQIKQHQKHLYLCVLFCSGNDVTLLLFKNKIIRSTRCLYAYFLMIHRSKVPVCPNFERTEELTQCFLAFMEKGLGMV